MFPLKVAPLLGLLLLATFPGTMADDTLSTETRELTYQIQTTWDDRPVDHEPVIITLAGKGSEGVEIKVDAPFFGVPGNPGGEPGKPFDKLWEHEVVEVFFADGDPVQPKYLEVELSPWGQHLVLLLDGAKNAIKTLLPIAYTAEINGNRWTGRAIIPLAYFPPKVTRFNAYAIHDVLGEEGDPRRYEALFPVPQGKYLSADYHRLDYFRPLNFELLQPGNNAASLPEVWSSSTRKLKTRPVQISLNNVDLQGKPSNASSTLVMEGIEDGENAWLKVTLSAVFMGTESQVPTGSADTPLPFEDLDSYETLRAYIANGEQKFLVLIFSPYGQYDVQLYNLPYHMISRGHRLDDVNITTNASHWTAQATIPLALLPANINKATVASVYTANNEIQYEASYTLENGAISLPDLMVLGKYNDALNLFNKGVNDANSDMWNEDS
ncbi:uncharacterized protein LOC124162420 isoform X2 [Ischnura elegans]|uniref:uncharacterized protein LOC124162420 isoform X2 n=1 Tax=Ischnura elegans TaxID=197161 RepID=UPI001ED89410|nr:uncharacterized protein LOC124162420 isoform X2 [Ischnura elegans]